jgi:hypothetical protein
MGGMDIQKEWVGITGQVSWLTGRELEIVKGQGDEKYGGWNGFVCFGKEGE